MKGTHIDGLAYYLFRLLKVALNAHQYADADQANGPLLSHQFGSITDGEHVANTLN